MVLSSRNKHRRMALVLKIVAIVLLFNLTSCIDLSQITTFSTTAKQADTALPALVNDLKGSCERYNSYVPKIKTEPVPKTRDCSQYDELSKGLSNMQNVLLNYIQALGQLSSDKAVTFSQGTSDLATNLKNAGLDEAASKATTGLAGKIADAVTNGYRRKKLAEFISAENTNVKVLTTALSDSIQKDYEQMLDNEKLAMESYYHDALTEKNATLEPLAEVLVEHQRQQTENDLQAKKKAADAYAKIMASIAEGHQKLNETGKSFNSKDLYQTLGKDIGDISGSVNDVYKAFK